MVDMKYSEAGVDVRRGDEASRIFYEASRATWANRVKSGFDDFTGLRYVPLPQGMDIVMGENFDGIGTKTDVAERLGKHDTIAFDLLAMVCDDAAMRGGEPFFVGNVLDVNRIELEPVKQLANGLEAAAKEAKVAVINGEIAELGDKIGGHGAFHYNWAASCLWFAKRGRLVSCKNVKVGDAIVALKEEGFRSNGFTLARKIMEKAYGKEWHEADRKTAEALLTPSRIYSPFIVSLLGGLEGSSTVEVHAMAHVTGGGIVGKLSRALKPSGLGAKLEDLFEPCPAMRLLQEIGKVSDDEAYKTWNMGNGFFVITPEPDSILKQAKKLQVHAQIAGFVTKEHRIRLKTS